MQLQRQHFQLNCFKTLSVGLAGVELTTSELSVRSMFDVNIFNLKTTM